MITNVPGPQIPLYAAGIPVSAMYPVATLTKGQTLALSVTSYNGRVFFGLTADREAMPDLADFGPLLQEAVDEFPATATRRSTRPETVPPMPTLPPLRPAAKAASSRPVAKAAPPRPAAKAAPRPAAKAALPRPAPKPAPPRPAARKRPTAPPPAEPEIAE